MADRDMTEGERHRALIFGLVGAKNHHRYMTSPQFRHAISSLAAMLPSMVDGLAEATDKADVSIEQMAEGARRIPEIDAEFVQHLRDAPFIVREYEGNWTPDQGVVEDA